MSEIASGARPYTLPPEAAEVVRGLWHQEDSEGNPLFSIAEIADIAELPCGTVSAMASRKGFRKRVSGCGGPAWSPAQPTSLHDAAPALLEALERCIAPLSKVRDATLEPLVTEWAVTLRMARDAIRRAKGHG